LSKERGDLYVGTDLDVSSRKPTSTRREIPAHHLTTHGVIVGMTGSGKTGLGVVLLEEVLQAGIPALILDPKGDMGNLALRFPDLAARDFEEWVDPAEAAREGIGTAELAARTAERWTKGLASSGLGTADVRAFTDGVDVRIFTPGSTAGISLNVLGNLSAPKGDAAQDQEALREEIEGLVSGLLVLAGIDADPITSREHILLANLVEHAWVQGIDLDLATLLMQIQDPPMRRLGVFELDTFFPAKDRMALAMRLNGLVASPSFAAWMQGDPLDMDTLLRAPDGRPRASVVYMSHLSETERQFVVTLLLAKMVTWMRQQPGTSDLKALVYVDEVFGLAPPTAEPPSKKPMLTIFKQARAHGVGMVISTQNPVDVDYKLMSNAGTWMIGRLQTERDKARIIDAMRSSSGDVDVASWSARIGELGKREFVLKTARTSQPTLFTSRWAMSFLRGPLTRAELLRLREAGALEGSGGEAGSAESAAAGSGADARSGAGAGAGSGASAGDAPGGAAAVGAAAESTPATDTAAAKPAPSAAPSLAELGHDETLVAPTVSSEARVCYLDPAAPWAREVGAGDRGGSLHAGLALRVKLLFDETKADLRHEEEWEAVLFPLGQDPRVDDAVAVDYDDRDFLAEPVRPAPFVLPPAPVGSADFFRTLKRDLQEHLYRSLTLDLFQNSGLKLYSRAGETEEAFRARCLEAAEQEADAEAAKLRDRFEKRLKTARQRRDAAARRVRELEVDVGTRRQHELVSGAGELLSMFLGGKARVRALSGAASRRSQTRRTQERANSAAEKLEDYENAIATLEDDLAQELEAVWTEWREKAEAIEPFPVPLEKMDIRVEDPVLFWASTE
jgi:hypothetical protein